MKEEGLGAAERARLAEADAGLRWRRWGPYLAERAWGTVREDYSADGNAWAWFPHDHARSRTYRWNEDGMAGICDDHQFLCLSLALWNGADPIMKERMFGLSGPEGNHGEDAKEYWFFLDSTPTHSWMRWRYLYPQAAFPYGDLVEGNARRSRLDPEYELLDTGVEHLVLRIEPGAPGVAFDEVAVGEGGLRVEVAPPHPRMGGRRVEEEPVLLGILAVVSLRAGEAEHALLHDGVGAVPEGEREAEELVVVADAGHAVLVPAVGAGAGMVMGEPRPGVAVSAVVLPDRPPSPLGEVRPPPPPPQPGVGLREASPLGRPQPLLLHSAEENHVGQSPPDCR